MFARIRSYIAEHVESPASLPIAALGVAGTALLALVFWWGLPGERFMR